MKYLGVEGIGIADGFRRKIPPGAKCGRESTTTFAKDVLK